MIEGTTGRLDPDAALRAGLAASMLVGVVTNRRVIGVPVLVAANTEQLLAILAPAIQDILAPRPTKFDAGHSGLPGW